MHLKIKLTIILSICMLSISISSVHAETIIWESQQLCFPPFIVGDLTTNEVLVGAMDTPQYAFINSFGTIITQSFLPSCNGRITDIIEVECFGEPYVLIFTNALPLESETGDLNVYRIRLSDKSLEGPYYLGNNLNDYAIYNGFILLLDGSQSIFPNKFIPKLISFDPETFCLTTIAVYPAQASSLIVDKTHNVAFVFSPGLKTVYRYSLLPCDNPSEWLLESVYTDTANEILSGFAYNGLTGSVYLSTFPNSGIIEVSGYPGPMTLLNSYPSSRSMLSMAVDATGSYLLGQCIGSGTDNVCGMAKITLATMSESFYGAEIYPETTRFLNEPTVVYGVFSDFEQEDIYILAVDIGGQVGQVYSPPEKYYWVFVSQLSEFNYYISSHYWNKIIKLSVI